MSLVDISRSLSARVASLRFAEPVCCVYNPLEYARAPHELYLSRYGRGSKEVLLLGMNPGPFGMAQTGVPFGDVTMVRDFLGIEGRVGKPLVEHPRRPIAGFACHRSEVSGTRFWGWARDRFGTAEHFFERVYVANWCPLVFMKESGANVPPDKLSAVECKPLFRACNAALARVAEVMQPSLVVAIGAFAEKRAREALDDGVQIGRILHPSPASPAANNWAAVVDAQLRALGFEPA
jgi:single-strand selective monofunctional uracil DNA glycosylase